MKVDQYLKQRTAELSQHQQTFQRLFYFLEDQELLFIPDGESWAAIECIEHLNFVSEHYLPQLKQAERILNGGHLAPEQHFNNADIIYPNRAERIK